MLIFGFFLGVQFVGGVLAFVGACLIGGAEGACCLILRRLGTDDKE